MKRMGNIVVIVTCLVVGGCATYPDSIHYQSLTVDDVEDAYKEAESLYARGDLRGSLRIYEQIIKFDRGYPFANEVDRRSAEFGFIASLYHKEDYDLYYNNLFSGAYLGAGYIRYKLGDYTGALARFEEARRIYRITRDPEGEALCLAFESHVLFEQGDYVGALRKEEAGMKFSGKIADLREMVRNLDHQERVSFRYGDMRTALERIRYLTRFP
ncbi:MAG: tetratricopeptide repeat protein [Deltaproteobacteria bacterium]|nr:MAG: tetratricopeptide repeat protein [Deltaproteobacteria bacterium]